MPLGTLDRDPPPFFRQGPSALSKLAVCSALAVFLMVADVRFQLVRPLRVALAAALYPAQWLAMQPLRLMVYSADYVTTVGSAQSDKEAAYRKLGMQSLKANQVDQLLQENTRLRKLLDLRNRVQAGGIAAQVIYDAADPYTRKVVIDKGMLHHLALGAPVLDEHGVLGQVTRVYPLVSEVTLVTDRDHAIPIFNTRTGARGIAFGDSTLHADGMEIRYMAANADVAVGDLLTTSGVDGVYPPGVPVARVEKIERRVDTMFARIYCVPVAMTAGVSHVLVLEPGTSAIPERPPAEPATPADGKRAEVRP